MNFYFPMEPGEQLAFISAVMACLMGCVALFAPGYALRFSGFEDREFRSTARAAVRSSGGLLIGFAGTALMLAQPMVYLAFGAALALAAFGRTLSILSDGPSKLRSKLLLVVEILLASLPLAYVFGLI